MTEEKAQDLVRQVVKMIAQFLEDSPFDNVKKRIVVEFVAKQTQVSSEQAFDYMSTFIETCAFGTTYEKLFELTRTKLYQH